MTDPCVPSVPFVPPVPSEQLPTIAMVGAGQLARMTQQAAISLGLSLRILAGAADESAALVAAGAQLGDGSDLETLRGFARGADVLTFDHEHVPLSVVNALQADGVRVFPAAHALRYAQDKLAMRERLGAAGFPSPKFRAVADVDQLLACGETFGWPLIVKTPSGGYDGKGVWQVSDAAAAREQLVPLFSEHPRLLVEERVAMRRELSAVVARSPYGQVACWPVTETVQHDGICVQTITPAPGLSDERAEEITRLAISIATELDVVGVLAVELFDIGSGVLINELAMRPHNSAHWTIEGARTSQFEQHLRAVLDYPLGSTALTAPAVVMANVLAGELPPGTPSLDERLHHLFAHDPAARVHLYGKSPRAGRKVGHVTVLAESPDDSVSALRARANAAAQWLGHGVSLT